MIRNIKKPVNVTKYSFQNVTKHNKSNLKDLTTATPMQKY